jgi:hypothetical protein
VSDKIEVTVTWGGGGPIVGWTQAREDDLRLNAVIGGLLYHSRRQHEVSVTITVRGTPLDPALMEDVWDQ